MRKAWHKAVLLGLLGIVTAVGTAVAAETVNIYNGRHYGTDRQLWDAFTKATGIRVNVVEGTHEQLVQRLLSEGANSPADVFITVDAGKLAETADQGLLAPTRSAALEAAIPLHLRSPDGLWFGLATRARVLVYAKDRIQPQDLSTYEALAEPRFKNEILVRSSNHPYNLSLIASLIEHDGVDATLDWCRGLVANFARSPEGGDIDQIKAVAAGVGDIAISNSYYLARILASDRPDDRKVADKVAVFFPNQRGRGAHVNITGAAVLRNAPHRANAVELLEYLASPEGQRYFADVSLEYPANPHVKAHPVLESWGEFKQDALNANVYAALTPEALKLADRCGWK